MLWSLPSGLNGAVRFLLASGRDCGGEETVITTLTVITSAAEDENGRIGATDPARKADPKTRPHPTKTNPMSQKFWNEME
jgi:hypothetical protein